MMRLTLQTPTARPLVGMIVFQVLCTLYFVTDTVVDAVARNDSLWHAVPEISATLGLMVGIAYEVRVLQKLLARAAQMQQGLDVARGALADVIAAYFRDWGLTEAERDVALFTMKGFSIAEIATLRRSAEGTIKTHLNAIYRKAGVPGRAQLVSLLVEDLLGAPIETKTIHRLKAA